MKAFRHAVEARDVDAVAALLADRSIYAGGSTFRGQAVLRISVSNWQTTADDIDLLVAVITRSLEQVRDKIEQRYTTALGQAELAQNSVQGRMLEVEQASIDAAGASRLAQLRASMGTGQQQVSGGGQQQIGGAQSSAEPATNPQQQQNPQAGQA